MNREELEKMFDEKIFIWKWNITRWDFDDIKQFIFETIIPEVLKSLLKETHTQNYSNISYLQYENNINEAMSIIKYRAKDLYWIIL